MVRTSGAAAIVETLRKQKVEVIFGISGGAIIPLHDVLRDSEIRHILNRHEQGAAHAAEGYARASGRPGVCLTTSGPGATNLVTGIANAYLDSSPIIAFTGQVNTTGSNSSYQIGRDAFQEADITGICLPITKYACQIKEVSEIPRTVGLAFHVATTGRPGPVLIDLPKNVQTDYGEVNFPKEIRVRGYHPQSEPHPLQVKKAVRMLRLAERPTVLAGGGVITSNAARELLKLVKLLMMPVTTTFMGKGAFPENHPLSLGTIGMHGTHVANKLILEADVILAVGTRFSDRTTGTLDTFCPDAKIIQIDIDTAEIGKNVKVHVPIVADARETLRLMHQQLLETKNLESSPWFRRVKTVKDQLTSEKDPNSTELKPWLVIKALRKILPATAIVTTEVGQNQMWAAIHFQTLKPRTFISSGGLGTMGFGFPAALGAKVACPDCAVVDIAGDGSFRMTEQELGCSITEHIPVIVIVLNNSMLGMVAQWQRMFCDHRYSAVELGNTPDFVKLAEAYGAQGIRVGSLKEFSRAMNKALKSEVTTVLDVPISPEENVFPMVPAGKGLKDMILG